MSSGIYERAIDILSSDLTLSYESDILVDNTIALIGDSPLLEQFRESYNTQYNIKHFPYIESFSGNLGNFKILLDENVESTSQIVFFSHFDILKPQLGIHFANEYSDEASLKSGIDELIGEFSYENTILYDKDKCQYHHRDKNAFSYCKSCVESCPNMSISSDDNKRELIFSNIDCILCGRCVSVCPSGAMQKSSATLSNITKATKLYKNKSVILISKSDLEKLDKEKLEDRIPLPLPNINLLNEVYLLSILQESARECVIIGKRDEILDESISFVNAIYERLFQTKPIFYLDNANVLEANLANIQAITLPHYSYSVDKEEFSREIFANRLSFFVKEGDFGVISNTKNILYTDIKINESKCTLCMSCVESCNAKAIINSKDNFSLLLNPSICTACGYCIDNCPEKCMEMSLEGIELKNSFFAYNIKAKDEPFACVECGKVFASAKSIKKVQDLIAPKFGNDEVKKRTLLCCSDCKVRVMFKGRV